LDDAAIEILAPALAEGGPNNSLTALYLQNNKITGNGLKPLVTAFKDFKARKGWHQLQIVDLSDNPLGDVGVVQLGEWITHLVVTYIIIQRIGMGEKTFSHLLKKCSAVASEKFVSLDVSGNNIGDAAIPAIVEAMKTLKDLVQLNISGCNITDAGFKQLYIAVRSVLNLCWCNSSQGSEQLPAERDLQILLDAIRKKRLVPPAPVVDHRGYDVTCNQASGCMAVHPNGKDFEDIIDAIRVKMGITGVKPDGKTTEAAEKLNLNIVQMTPEQMILQIRLAGRPHCLRCGGSGAAQSGDQCKRCQGTGREI